MRQVVLYTHIPYIPAILLDQLATVSHNICLFLWSEIHLMLLGRENIASHWMLGPFFGPKKMAPLFNNRSGVHIILIDKV